MQHFLDTTETIPAGMGFSYFSPFHLCWLGGIAAAIFLLCRLYRRSGAARRQRIRSCLALLTVADELFKDACLLLGGNFDPSYLPLHLCSINIFLVAIHARKPSKLLENFLYAFCVVPAAAALLFPDWSYYPALHFMTVCSFVLHILLVCYTLMQTVGGDIRPETKYLPQCLGIMMGIAIPVYVFDILTDTNYLFLNWPSPGSPLELFAFLGRPAYLLGYIPLVSGAWLLLYLPFIRKERTKSA